MTRRPTDYAGTSPVRRLAIVPGPESAPSTPIESAFEQSVRGHLKALIDQGPYVDLLRRPLMELAAGPSPQDTRNLKNVAHLYGLHIEKHLHRPSDAMHRQFGRHAGRLLMRTALSPVAFEIQRVLHPWAQSTQRPGIETINRLQALFLEFRHITEHPELLVEGDDIDSRPYLTKESAIERDGGLKEGKDAVLLEVLPTFSTLNSALRRLATTTVGSSDHVRNALSNISWRWDPICDQTLRLNCDALPSAALQQLPQQHGGIDVYWRAKHAAATCTAYAVRKALLDYPDQAVAELLTAGLNKPARSAGEVVDAILTVVAYREDFGIESPGLLGQWVDEPENRDNLTEARRFLRAERGLKKLVDSSRVFNIQNTFVDVPPMGADMDLSR